MSNNVELIKKNFNITPQVLEDRKNIGLYVESLSSLIVDKFYDYLLSSPDFAKLIDKAELPILKRIRTEFIVSLFNDEFDEDLIFKIKQAHKDSPIKTNSFIVASTFETIMQTIIDIASVNHQLQRGLKTIYKFLHIAEFIIQEELVKENQQKISISKNDLVNALESLFEMLSIHKSKHELLLECYEDGAFGNCNSNLLPSNNVLLCQFNDTILHIKELVSGMNQFSIDINAIDELHKKYHKEVKFLYNSIEENLSQSEQKIYLQEVITTSKKLFEFINKPFEQVSSLTFLTVNGGTRFIQQYGQILNESKFIPFGEPLEISRYIENILQESLKNSLSWAISSYEVNITHNLKDSDIADKIVFNNSSIYISLNVEDIPYKTFIFDILYVFLEILKITLINREKEHKLTIFADKAESANRSKDVFLANMSHELRTPLNAIIGFSQILQTREEIPQNMRSYIEKISIAGNNLLNLVNTILDFAKLEAGKMSYHPKMTLLSDIVKEISIIISPLAEAKNISITMPSDISLALFIDTQLMKQSLINILSNAIKFTPDNGKVVFSIMFSKTRNQYVLSVCDNGVGMSKESMSEIFKPFMQADNHLQASSKGTGLGLVITKKIVEDIHGGKIWVESTLGEGSCFYISIPIKDDLTTVEVFASKNEDNEKLLIVEDTPEYVKILVDNLLPFFNITVTNSINKAKELLEKNDYDKIILDFFLIDGICSEVLFFMENKEIHTPAYIISAEDDFKIVEHLQESSNIMGVFNKRDTVLICDTIKGV
jgi:signal transduction histidine kinase